jgi:hypothetical protein
VLSPEDLVDHYRLEDQLTQQLYHGSIRKDVPYMAFQSLDTKSNMKGPASILAPLNPYLMNTTQGLVEVIALLLIWFLIH